MSNLVEREKPFHMVGEPETAFQRHRTSLPFFSIKLYVVNSTLGRLLLQYERRNLLWQSLE